MASKFIGDHSGDGSLLTNVNAQTIDGYDSSEVYRTVAKSNASVGPGWVTVASNPTARYFGEVVVSDPESSDHAFIRIDWMRSYADSNFSVINVGGHANRITGARVLYNTADNTYGTKLLQVYVTVASNYTVSINAYGNQSGWGNHSVVTPVVQNTISGYAVHGAELTGLEACTMATEEGFKAGGGIIALGDVTAYSDARLKTDVEKITDATAKVEALNGVTFTRTTDDSRSTGLIAQEVLAVLPEAVTEDSEGLYAVKYGNLVGLVVEAIKELKAENTELRTMIEELRNGK